MSGHLRECCGEFFIFDMLDSDFEIHAIRALRMVEEPANVISAILKSDMGHGSLPSGTRQVRTPFSTDGVMGVSREIGHLHVRTRSEHRGAHPVSICLVLRQDPFAYATFAVIVTGAEFES